MIGPYAENSVVCGDCLELMRELPDGCVDVCLTDLPYGVGLDYGTYEDTTENLRRIVADCLPEMRRVATVVAFTCGVTNTYMMPRPTWVLAWACSGAGSLCQWGFNAWQPVCVYGPDPYLARKRGCRQDLIYINSPAEQNGHPCPKPIKVWHRILERVSPDATDIVLDPFLGSGTTGVACVQTGRRFLGFEINPDYCEIARRRIAEAQAQPRLFDAEPAAKPEQYAMEAEAR